MTQKLTQAVRVQAKMTPAFEEVLTPAALAFVARLAQEFEPERARLMAHRAERLEAIAAGQVPSFLPETESIRRGEWQVAAAPADLRDRRVEITGPAERKMVINALNSGAQVFMADFEDANSPTWENMVEGQINLRDAARRTIRYTGPDGRQYRLGEKTAVLLARPRGWHLPERHVTVRGKPVAGSLFDAGLYLFHNAQALLERGSGPYFYLPKLESHREARLWNQVFAYSEEALSLPRGSIRATVLVEHVLAAFEMEEVLYELRERITGINLGRWDYIFSFIKTFRHRPDLVLPDRKTLTVPATPFLRSAARLLVQTAHKRGAHAMGGMSAFIPRKDDPEVNQRALEQVRDDKRWEASQGFDGAWVAHPGLVAEVHGIFQEAFSGPNQMEKLPDGQVIPQDLLQVPQGPVTEEGVRVNTRVAIQYLGAWLAGRGAVAISNLMEDTATAEISRSQLWQWLRHKVALAGDGRATPELYRTICQEELQRLRPAQGEGEPVRYQEAAELLNGLVLAHEYTDFLTLPGYERLE